jgi:hypothetical protein
VHVHEKDPNKVKAGKAGARVLQAKVLASLGPNDGLLTHRSSPTIMWLANRLDAAK